MNRLTVVSLFLVLSVCSGEARSHEFTFSGRVTKPDGSPAAGALVYLASQMGNVFLEPPVTVRCDADGKFFGLKTSVYRTTTIHAVGEDRLWQSIAFVPFSAARAVAAKPLDMVLARANRTAVRVSKAGGPVSGCKVAINGVIGSGVVTDKSGEATLFYPPINFWAKRVVAFHKDHGVMGWTSETPTDPLPESLELSLEPIAERTVRVVDHLNQPVLGLNLRFYVRSDTWSASLEMVPESWVQTDSKGVASAAWLPKRSQYVGVTPLSAKWERVSTIAGPDEASTIVQLKKTHLFQGRVRFPDGRPRAGVAVVAAGTDGGRFSTSWARTDKTGSFRIYVAADRAYFLNVMDSEWTSDLRGGVLLRTVGDDIKYDRRGTFLSARAATPVEVSVHNRLGLPVRNAWVYSRVERPIQWVDQADENQKSRVVFTDWRLTDSNGLATFAVGAGTHAMRVSVPGWGLTKEIEVVEGKPAQLAIQEPE